MPQAKVTSVDAINAFRAKLIIYVSKARQALEEVTGDLVRTRAWLETDRRVHWESQVRRRARLLEEAQAAVFASRLSSMREVSAAEQMTFRRAKGELSAAEDKLKTIKKWTRELDTRLEPLIRQLEKLHTILSHDMTNAIVHLAQVVNTLDSYADVSSSSERGAAPAPGEDALLAERAPAKTAPGGNT